MLIDIPLEELNILELNLETFYLISLTLTLKKVTFIIKILF